MLEEGAELVEVDEGGAMSDCRNGGRFSHRWGDQVWKTPQGRDAVESGCVETVTAILDGGEPVELELDARGRKVLRFEFGGVPYTSDGLNLVEHYSAGICYAVDLDGVRYTRTVDRDWDSETID